MSQKHHSWSNDSFSQKFIDLDTFLELKTNQLSKNHENVNRYIHSFQNGLIPVFDVTKIDLFSDDVQKTIYNEFFNNAGAIIVKNMYDVKIMDNYNKWSIEMLDKIKNDGNFLHPKQQKKFLINDVIGRMSKDNPDLLVKLIADENLNKLMDILLGFSKIGSCTGHWIQPNGDRQLSHVDYPMHVGSGAFWNHDVNKLTRLTTKYQLNNILPYFSLQILIATDSMNKKNGSTEIVPCSHKIPNLDILLHNKDGYNFFENKFINVELEKGDILIFNRRLCHRGGKNKSSERRNSLIMQCVWLWGVGQEIIEYDNLLNNLSKSEIFNNFTEEEKELFLLRLKGPYPIDVKEKT